MSNKKDNLFLLELKLERLNADLGEVTELLEQVQGIADDCKAGFKLAHHECLAFVSFTFLPRREARAAYLEALENRRVAGQAWHPHREKLSDLSRWHKLVLSEIRDTRHNIEAAQKRDPKPPSGSQPSLL